MHLTRRLVPRFVVIAVVVVLMVMALVVVERAKVIDLQATLAKVVLAPAPVAELGPAVVTELPPIIALEDIASAPVTEVTPRFSSSLSSSTVIPQVSSLSMAASPASSLSSPASFPPVQFVAPRLANNTIHMYGDGRCSVDNIHIQVGPPTDVDELIPDILMAWKQENSTYFHDVMVLVDKSHDLDAQLSDGTVSQHWYRFAGLLVWLEEFQVHMMILRLIYTPKGDKQKPLFSLMLVHLYDANWTPVETTLSVPDGNGNRHDQRFPHVMPIPFYHDVTKQYRHYYGPEDPRILMVNNELGHQEPMVVFNMYTRDFAFDKAHSTLEYYRAMYVAWPWQHQTGKGDTDGHHSNFGDYTRTSRLTLEGQHPNEKEKNWTPFIDGNNSLVYFVYRWDQFEVVECPLGTRDLTKDYTLCNFIQTADDVTAKVGALRGGTELVSFASLGYSNTPGWFSIARAHLENCGCSPDMYRPNVVIMDRDDNGKLYLRAMLGFADWNIPVGGFYNDNAFCGELLVLIPNGLSRYHRDTDLMEITYSVADKTVLRIALQGLVSQLAAYGSGGDVLTCGMRDLEQYCEAHGKKYGGKGLK